MQGNETQGVNKWQKTTVLRTSAIFTSSFHSSILTIAIPTHVIELVLSALLYDHYFK